MYVFGAYSTIMVRFHITSATTASITTHVLSYLLLKMGKMAGCC